MLNLYTEIALRAAAGGQPILYEIPRKNGSIDDKSSSRRSKSHTRDEEDYQSNYLSSDGNVYFRTKQDVTPRSCLWTVSGEDRVLQLQPADLARNERDTNEACLNLQFAFQDPIREHAIDISDSDHDDALHVFVSTTKNEVYHLTIPPRAFKSRDILEKDTKQWCYALEASSFSIDNVFRLRAQSPFELFVCYISGKIQRLLRKADTRKWEPTIYNPGGGHLLSRFTSGAPRRIEYGATTVDTRAAQSMQASPDSNFLYTVCLNHRLRVIHLPSGKAVVEKDLLDLQGDTQERTLSALDRGHLQYLHGGPEMRNSILVTFSPREGGQFKLWDVKGGLTDDLTIEDRYPDARLTPPDPDPTGNTIWSLISFRVVPQGELDARGSAQIWILWRNNNHHKLFSTQFDFDDIERGWEEHNWVSSAPTDASIDVPDVTASGCDDPASLWLEYLFLPGRYPPEVLETALSMYTASSTSLPPRHSPLQVRVAGSIASNASPKKQEPNGMNFDLFAWDVDQAWRSFHRTVEKVNSARLAPLVFAYDSIANLPVMVMADQIVVVRECDRLELVGQSEEKDLEQLERVCAVRWPHRQVVTEERGITYQSLAQLLQSTASFVDEFPTELVQGLEACISDAMFVAQEKAMPWRIYDMYDEVNFQDAISNDTFDRLESNLKDLGGFQGINNELVLAAIDLLPEPSPRNKHDLLLASTNFGLKVLSAGMHDYLHLTRDILWNLLVLIIFIDGECCQDGDSIPGFNAAELFAIILPILKTVQRNIWLAQHSRQASVAAPASKTSSERHFTSLLEDRFLKAVKPRSDGSKPRSYLLTALLHEADEFMSRDDPGYDNGSVMLLCDMLQRGELRLATEFSRFIPSTPWAIYIKGRLMLARRQYDEAEQYFRQAAYRMACGRAPGDVHQLSFGFISPVEVDSFYNGLPRYFHHILHLFDTSRAYAQSSRFAQLTLQALTPDQKVPSLTFRSEVLSRLFTAQLKQSNFRAAFGTLSQFTDAALQKSSASALITTILDPEHAFTSVTDSVAILQSLPWALHPHLAAQLDAQLNNLAKKQKIIYAEHKRNTSVDSNVDYLKIVHAMRLAQGDYRGAVAALYDRLRLVQRQGRLRSDPESAVLRHALLALINAMTCVPPEEAYILAESEAQQDTGNVRPNKRRRMIITLADLRKEYQRVLDRCARVERGDFDFGDAEDSDEDMVDDGRDTSRMELTILDGGRDRGLLAF